MLRIFFETQCIYELWCLPVYVLLKLQTLLLVIDKEANEAGWQSLQTAVNHQLKFLLSTSAHRQYSWFGRKGKKAFVSLVIAAIIASKPSQS